MLLRGRQALRRVSGGCVATIGNFDGVHRGHQMLLRRLRELSVETGLPACVVLFEPHPQEFFAGAQAPARIMTLREKLEALARHGVEQVLCLRFSRELASMSATRFVDELLVRGLRVAYLVVGDDFRFGHQRQGDYALLQGHGGFAVEASMTIAVDGERASSTAVRAALAEGRFEHARHLLGNPFSFTGKVAHGDARGRQLGFPTANLRLHRTVLPLHGVYAVRVSGAGELPLQGVANIGARPTVGGTEPRLEVHLFDFSGDLYGRRLRVEPLCKLRGEQKFASLEALKNQIAEDARQAREWFAAQPDAR